MVEIKMKPYDSCCWHISMEEDGKQINTGLWCPQSNIVAIDGEVIGYCDTKEEVIAKLKLVEVTVSEWRIVE